MSGSWTKLNYHSGREEKQGWATMAAEKNDQIIQQETKKTSSNQTV